jgi:hypothetical protein
MVQQIRCDATGSASIALVQNNAMTNISGQTPDCAHAVVVSGLGQGTSDVSRRRRRQSTELSMTICLSFSFFLTLPQPLSSLTPLLLDAAAAEAETNQRRLFVGLVGLMNALRVTFAPCTPS